MAENREKFPGIRPKVAARPSLRRRAAIVGFVSLALALSSWGQSGNQGLIEGIITDSTGGVVSGVTLKVTNLDTSATFSTTSDGDGLFRFSVLPIGTYELVVQHDGFATLIQRNIDVRVGSRINLNLSLTLANQSESIRVISESPLIESTRSQTSFTLDNRTVTSLPVNGRKFIDFALLTPGVTRDSRTGLSFAGQRGMNSVLMDGVDNNNTFFGGGLSPIGPYQISLEAVQEFQVNSNSYSAEFGRAGSGVINMVTKSGSNEFHGVGFWYYRDRSMNANDLVNQINRTPKSPFHFNQFGGSVGGPIVRNKLFFFQNYDGQRSTVPNAVFLNLPFGFQLSTDSRVADFQQRALTYLVPRSAPWLRTSDQNVYLTKLDWSLNSAHQLSARWNRQRFTGEGSEAMGPQISFEHTGGTLSNTDTLEVSLTSALAPSLVNVARFSYILSDEPGFAGSINPEANVFEGGQLVLSVGRHTASPRQNTIEHGQWNDTLSYQHGSHALRFGLDVLTDYITFFNATNFSGSYRFGSLESFGRSLAGAPAPRSGEFFRQAFSGEAQAGSITHPNFKEFSGFAQDEWRVRPRLTVNLGLRYDLQVIAKPPVKNPSTALAAAGLDTSILRTDKNNFAPRLGFAWSPFQNRRLVVRFGYGIFYAQTPSIMTARAFFQNGISIQTRTFFGGTPGAALIPTYPNTLCGAPNPSGTPPTCPAPPIGANDTLMFFSPDYLQPRTQHGSFGIEYELQKDLAASISYLVVRGSHLPRLRDVNLGTPTVSTSIGIANTSTILTYQRFVLPRPIASFDRILLFESDATSIYHGLAATLTKRFSHEFEFSGSYTLSKVIDDAPEFTAVNPGLDDFRLLSDASNPRADRSAGLNDQRHRFVLSGIWQLDYARRLPAVARAIVGGWELSGIFTAQSGQPYSGFVNFDLNNDGNSSNDRTPGLGRNTLYLPATISFDPRVTRNVQLSEKVKLQIIGEAFDVFNHGNITSVRTTQFSVITCSAPPVPCTLLPQNKGLSAFGTPTATAGPRIMQLAAKLVF